jgi:CRP-like cAMP-binding protein
VISYAAGETVSAESDDSFQLVMEGAATVLAATQGGPFEIARLERGAFFGEDRVLGSARRAALVAASEATLVAFPAPVIAAMCERFPKLRKLLETVHAARERNAAQKVAP